jgi:hypothetical protein
VPGTGPMDIQPPVIQNINNDIQDRNIASIPFRRIRFRRWLRNFNGHSMKKNFVLVYQSIYELSFITFFLITYFVTKDYKWFVVWPLIDNFYSYVLIWTAHEDQKKWFVDHAANIDPRSRNRVRKKPFGLYILLEICKTVVISLCMHSVFVKDDIEMIWIGFLVLIVIDVILLGDDALLNVIFIWELKFRFYIITLRAMSF